MDGLINPATTRNVPSPLEIELEAHADLCERDGVWSGTARVEPTGPSSFAFREDGALALIVPVIEFGQLIDVVAVTPRHPRGLLRLDFATVLGGDNLDRARLFDRRPVLVETPMDWLARPGSVCILNVEQDAVEALAGVPRVTCATLRLAERVEAAHLRPPRVPIITVVTDG